MNRNELFPSRFLKCADLQGRAQTVIVERVDLEDVGDEAQKPVAHFRKCGKGLVLNATNYDTIADAYGDETDNWPGKAIEVYPTRVPFKGKLTDAIRVRIPTATAPAAKPVTPKTSNDQRPEPPAEAYANDLDDEIVW